MARTLKPELASMSTEDHRKDYMKTTTKRLGNRWAGSILAMLFSAGMMTTSVVQAEAQEILSNESLANSGESTSIEASTQEPAEKSLGSTSELTEVPDKPVVLSASELKKKVIRLNRDLFILEEDLLFPANTQYVVYVSLDTGKFFRPDSLTLKLNDELVAAHLYTERQVRALQRGGMQRLHMGNVKSGEHEVTVTLIGKGPDNREYKRAAHLLFEKDSDIAALEIQINDKSANYQPEVTIVKWD